MTVRKIRESERWKGRRKAKSAPQPDWGLVYREQVRLRRCDSPAGDEECRLRALEFTVNAYRAHQGRACSLEQAGAAVRAAIATKGKTS